MTRGGRRPSMFALVLAGNGMGACGFATAKGSEARIAEEKAEKRAIRNLQFIPRLDDRTSKRLTVLILYRSGILFSHLLLLLLVFRWQYTSYLL